MQSASRVLSLSVALAAIYWAAAVETAPPPPRARPVPLILDTDMDTDCDDAGAMAVMHALADRGEVRILATMVSSRLEGPAQCVQVINRYYGRPDLPIGMPKSKNTGRDRRDTRYAREVGAMLPVRHKTNAEVPDAAIVYRQVLAAAADDSVVLVTVGDLTNLRDLLATRPDPFSPLSGKGLIARKIKLWVCMGSSSTDLNSGVFGNFKPDPDSTVIAVRDWPGTVLFSGLGEEILTGATLKTTPENNPVRKAYELYLRNKPTRPSWDQIAVLYAVRPGLPWWCVETGGRNHIFDNGTNEWRDGPDTNHKRLKLRPGSPEPLRALLDELMAAAPLPTPR